ncbi:unnamed protein product [Rotaria socialis]|nr:unnamed protein product [Rotaria socialis]
MCQYDIGFEQPNSSTGIRNRLTMNNRPSTDHLANSSSLLHSYSTNGIIDAYRNSTVFTRPNTNDPLDNLPSKQIQSLFDGNADRQISTNDSLSDDQLQQSDGNSQVINSSNDDRQSVSSVGKPRKQIIATKFFKPFQNIRFRKKIGTS